MSIGGRLIQAEEKVKNHHASGNGKKKDAAYKDEKKKGVTETEEICAGQQNE